MDVHSQGAAGQEVQLVNVPLAALAQRVRQLLHDFPENPLLEQLLQLAARVQGVCQASSCSALSWRSVQDCTGRSCTPLFL